ncbi:MULTISPECIES: CD1375 family protein [unclassified Sporosarcina]|nr:MULTISPECIES: CD1375 family protein [unclassified Sporosarcina]
MPIAVIYVALIMSGDKTYTQVPKHVQPEVKRQLELLGYGELAE